MKQGETLVIMGIFTVMLLFIVLLGYIGRRNSLKEKFIFKEKLKNINWKKTIRYWVWIQAFTALASIGNNKMYWFETIGLPIIIMGIIFVNGLSVSNTNPEYHELAQGEEFENWKKVEERDIKIKKILKNKL